MKIALIVIGILLIILTALYLFLIAPGAPRDIDKFKSLYYAHRGLHSDTVAENSMTAFRLAVEAGFGIELDVRLSSDNVLVVFHDDTLDRVAGIEGRVDAFTAEELSKMSLSGTEDGVPTFREVLELVDGKVPLLVEIKEDAGNSAVSTKAAEMLAQYKGDYIVESFNPLSIANVKKHLQNVTAGVLSHRYMDFEKYRKPLYFLLQCLFLNAVCRPAFIAYDHRHYSSLSLRIARRLFGAATIAWTVRSPEEEAAAKAHGFDGIIFENYIPSLGSSEEN